MSVENCSEGLKCLLLLALLLSRGIYLLCGRLFAAGYPHHGRRLERHPQLLQCAVDALRLGYNFRPLLSTHHRIPCGGVSRFATPSGTAEMRSSRGSRNPENMRGGGALTRPRQLPPRLAMPPILRDSVRHRGSDPSVAGSRQSSGRLAHLCWLDLCDGPVAVVPAPGDPFDFTPHAVARQIPHHLEDCVPAPKSCHPRPTRRFEGLAPRLHAAERASVC